MLVPKVRMITALDSLLSVPGGHGPASLNQALVSADQRKDVVVPHPLRHVTSQGAAEAPTAVHNEFLVVIRELGLDISLKNTLPKMICLSRMTLRPL